MSLPRPKRFVAWGLVAAGATLAGCEPGTGAAAGSRTTSGDGPNVSVSSADAPKADENPSPSESGDDGPGRARTDAAAPVTTDRSTDIGTKKPSIELTAAERTDAAPPAVSDAPPVDASRFPGGIVPASPNAQPLPGGPRLLVPERTFRPEGKPRALRVNYDDLDLLRVLNMGDPLPTDVADHFPKWLRDLDGKTVRLRGFMAPAYEEEPSAFIFTRDTGECCFGPFPKPYYLIPVKMKEGTKARYVENRPFDVVGTFHIDPKYVDGTWYRIYKITDAVVPE